MALQHAKSDGRATHTIKAIGRIGEDAMPFVAVNEVVRAAITFNDSAGNEAVNVLHFKADEFAPSESTINTLIDTLVTWLTTEWADVASSEWRAVRIEARDLTSEFSFYVSRTISVAGTSVSSGLPPQDTVAISLRSPFSGRSKRGRLYHVGLAEDSQEGGYLNPTAVTNLIAAYEALMIASAGVLWVWGVVSYVAEGAPRVTPLFTPITDIVITDTIIDSMDKRKPRG